MKRSRFLQHELLDVVDYRKFGDKYKISLRIPSEQSLYTFTAGETSSLRKAIGNAFQKKKKLDCVCAREVLIENNEIKTLVHPDSLTVNKNNLGYGFKRDSEALIYGSVTDIQDDHVKICCLCGLKDGERTEVIISVWMKAEEIQKYGKTLRKSLKAWNLPPETENRDAKIKGQRIFIFGKAPVFKGATDVLLLRGIRVERANDIDQRQQECLKKIEMLEKKRAAAALAKKRERELAEFDEE